MSMDADVTRRIEQIVQLYVLRTVASDQGVPESKIANFRRFRLDLVAFIAGKQSHSATEQIILAVDRALTTLEANSLSAARVMELRYFSSLDTQAIAIKVGNSVERVRRDTRFGRAVLLQELKASQVPPAYSAVTNIDDSWGVKK